MIDRIRKAVSSFVSTPDLEVDALRAANAVLREERDRLQQQKDDQFDFLLRMERQRDEWRARFHEQWRQHQNAQAMLEAHIYSVGSALVNVLRVVNAEREKRGETAFDIASAKRLAEDGERVLRTSAEYGDAMRKLEATRPLRQSGQILGWTDEAVEPDLSARRA